MRDNYQQQLAQKLRNKNQSFTEMGKIISFSRNVGCKLCVYKRVSHPKKVERNPLLQKANKLNTKRRILMLTSAGPNIVSPKIKNNYNLSVCRRTIRRHIISTGNKYVNPKNIFLTKCHKKKK